MEDKRLFFSQNDWNENVAQTFPFISPLCPNDFWACEGVPLKGRQSFYFEAISTSVWFSVPINMLWGPHTVQETNFEEWGRERSEHAKPRGLNHFCPKIRSCESLSVREVLCVCERERVWVREREGERAREIENWKNQLCVCVCSRKSQSHRQRKKTRRFNHSQDRCTWLEVDKKQSPFIVFHSLQCPCNKCLDQTFFLFCAQTLH